jgi:alkaline phosphatase D
VGTSITSALAKYWVRRYERARDDNPHVKYFDGRPGGYVRCDLTPERWRSDLRLADSILDYRSPVRTVASFVVENGCPGATRA